MNLRLRREEPNPPPLPSGDVEIKPLVTTKPDAIEQWLGSVSRLMRVPERSRGAIREELDGHIRERIRDLMVEGESEHKAIRRALDELGSAAELARRFDAAHRNPRRALMHTSLFVVAGSALALSIGAYFSTPTPPASSPTPPPAFTPAPAAKAGTATTAAPVTAAAAAAPAAAIAGTPTPDPFAPGMTAPSLAPSGRATFSTTANAFFRHQPPVNLPKTTIEAKESPLDKLLLDIAGRLGTSWYIHWDELEEMGVERDRKITLRLVDVPVETAIKFINIAGKINEDNALEYRVTDGVLEFAPRSYFDKREATLVCYELATLSERGVNLEEFVAAIQQIVEPQGWKSNGGESATGHLIADRFFVTASKRCHERIAWVIARLESGGNAARSDMVRRGPGLAAAVAANDATPTIFVDGGVARPGVYALPPGDPVPMTAARAITAAGGTKSTASDVFISRYNGSKEELVIQLRAADVLGGKGQDPYLRPGDRVLVR